MYCPEQNMVSARNCDEDDKNREKPGTEFTNFSGSKALRTQELKRS